MVNSGYGLRPRARQARQPGHISTANRPSMRVNGPEALPQNPQRSAPKLLLGAMGLMGQAIERAEDDREAASSQSRSPSHEAFGQLPRSAAA
jgi:hypothetical protein